MEIFWIIFYTILAYLIGGVPSAFWLGKLYYGIDIRDHGNGSVSHLNVELILGKKASWLVRLTDVTKGVLAARLSFPLTHQIEWLSGSEAYILTLTLGLAAMLGHIFPLLAGFKGGQGYYVAIGVLLAAHPAMSFMFLGITLLVYSFTNLPYLAYVIGAISLPLFVLFTRASWDDKFLPMLVFGLVIFSLLLITHLQNLKDINFKTVTARWHGSPFRRH
ncbi:MAG: glycerol-3-phosphate acyltransferase [Bacteroidia bacterium]|nr:glycerol-3-phosphate acyltransferase [Bacteroidia bacterium]